MSDLTDRMRTCAAFILGRTYEEVDSYIVDAANLLNEAATKLEEPIEERLGEPIDYTWTEVKVVAGKGIISEKQKPIIEATWIGDDLKSIPNQPISKNACPKCDSRTTKIVHATGPNIELECPVCGYRWKR